MGREARDGSSGYPLPPRGYFGAKVLWFSGLQVIHVCKIFMVNGLRLKYLLSIS